MSKDIEQITVDSVISLDMAAEEFSRAYSRSISALVVEKLAVMNKVLQLKARIAELEKSVPKSNKKPDENPSIK